MLVLPNYDVLQSLNTFFFILTKSVNPNEMAFHLGRHCLHIVGVYRLKVKTTLVFYRTLSYYAI